MVINNNRPRISIGMPVYNGEPYLKDAINSILNQTFEDFELIISDNGSTDRTEEICRTIASQDQRVRYYRNEQNLGAGWNFNRVVDLATGEYFRWACHDDIQPIASL
ncbi:glycosyltransferase family 2 protein [Gloeocapsa sp. PCC 7428]|uniref:glycosyltransferase family 2 protein n=1 Tax=Gloeocapsa sp. PCC 7428 TaxID=1173026 RepID=UPI0009DA28D4|nr:glycosyltransferase family 2 protein [Gloeocapsa sp. PCC 7428]